MNVALVISYDGSCFKGFQIQPDVRTVQQTLEKALGEILGEQIRIAGSGRTDAGVHAIGQVVNFTIKKSLKTGPDWITIPLNHLLAGEITARNVRIVPEEFHSRFSARRKRYVYWVRRGLMQPWLRNYCWTWDRRDWDRNLLQEVCRLFEGEHDFAGYAIGLEPRMATVRTVYSLETAELEHGLLISVEGSGFLRGMVRVLVSAMLHCAAGYIGISELEKQLGSPGKVNLPAKAPPGGLYLHSVTY